MEIQAAKDADHAEIIEVWEASVRATHDFLEEEDIEFLRPLVPEYLSLVDLHCARDEGGAILGFVGVAQGNVEMLFLRPDARRRGLGTRLLEFAIRDLGANRVDVNEQNSDACAFYLRCGFRVVGRSPLDGQGRPFPILHLELRPEEKASSRHGWLSCLVLMWLGAQFGVGCAAGEEPNPWQGIELGTSAEFRDVFFLDARRGWMVGAAGVRNPGGILARTTDGGKSWDYQTGLVGPRSGSTSVDLNAVVFLDSLRGVLAGESGTVLRTEDGGEHWKTIPPTGPVYAHHQDMDFVDADHGWIVGRNGVLRTEDAGESWERVDEGRDITGRAIDFIDLDLGWVVGKNAAVFRSRDGGVSWEQVQVLADQSRSQDQNSPNFTAVCFVDDGHGWIAGYQREFPGFEQHDRGIIVHTEDGGLHWTEQLHEVESLLTAIAFTDIDHGWAVGYNVNDSSARVLYTDDGGSIWNTQATMEGGTLLALAVRDGSAWTVGRRIGAQPQRLWEFTPAVQGIGEVEGSH